MGFFSRYGVRTHRIYGKDITARGSGGAGHKSELVPIQPTVSSRSADSMVYYESTHTTGKG